ncbi:MAG: UPF0271 protein [Rhodothermales bacterium]|jgi:UPF0271 protein
MGQDEDVMPLIDWANIACGGHAGDPDTMSRTLGLARKHGVKAGAHPGYPDKRNFGRMRLDMSVDSLVHEVQAQIGALQALATAEGVVLNHVKPHGALYNTMMEDWGLLVRLGQAVAALDDTLIFVLQATPDSERHAMALRNTGLQLAFEAFADRRYRPDGRLQSRAIAGSVLTDPADVEAHARNVMAGFVETETGRLNVRADTICVHGDNPQTLEAIRRIKPLLGQESA